MKDIVTLEQAKKLSARGFVGEWPQLVYVWIPGGYYALELWRGPQFLMIESPTRYVPDPWYYPAPTLLTALDWLEGKHGWNYGKSNLMYVGDPTISWWAIPAIHAMAVQARSPSALLDAILEKLEVPA